jgi:hypothetical protein
MASPAVKKVVLLTILKLLLLLIELLSDSVIVAAKIQLYDAPAGLLLVESCLSSSHLFRHDRSVWKYARQAGICDNYLLASYNDKMFKSRMRLSKAIFHKVCSDLAPALEKVGSHLNTPLSVHLKVAAVVYKLAHGISNPVISDMFGIGTCTVSVVLRDFVSAVLLILKLKYVRWPASLTQLQKLAEGFEGLRDSSNCRSYRWKSHPYPCSS